MLGVGSIALLGGLAFAPALFAQQQGGGMQGGQRGGQQGQTLRIGEQAPQVNLKDLDGKTHTLDMHKGEVVVLEWIDPTNLQWMEQHRRDGELQQQYTRFKQQGVTWLGICSFNEQGGMGQQGQQPRTQGQQTQQGGGFGQQQQQGQQGVLRMNKDQAEQACERAKQTLNLDFPILLDEGGQVAQRFKISHIPHVVIVDQQGKVAYEGRIAEAGQVAQLQQFERALNQTVQGGGSLPAGAPRDQQQRQGQQGQQQGQPRGR